MGMKVGIGFLEVLPEAISNAQLMGVDVTIKADARHICRGPESVVGGIQIASSLSTGTGAALSRAGASISQLQERRITANAKGRNIRNTDK